VFGLLMLAAKKSTLAPAGLIAGGNDQRRHYIGVGRCRREGAGWDDGGKLIGGQVTPSLAQFSLVITDVIMRKGPRTPKKGSLGGGGVARCPDTFGEHGRTSALPTPPVQCYGIRT